MSTKTIVEKILEQGAVMRRLGDYEATFLVATFAWLDERRVFWFTVGGESEFDGHVLEFDEARAPHALGIEFVRDGQLVGYLTTIEEADLDNEPDFLRAHEAWKAVAADHAEFIERCRRSHLT